MFMESKVVCSILRFDSFAYLTSQNHVTPTGVELRSGVKMHHPQTTTSDTSSSGTKMYFTYTDARGFICLWKSESVQARLHLNAGELTALCEF